MCFYAYVVLTERDERNMNDDDLNPIPSLMNDDNDGWG